MTDDIQRQLDIATWVRNIATEDAVSFASPPRANAASTLKWQKKLPKKAVQTSSPVGDNPVTIVKTPKEAVQAAKKEVKVAAQQEESKEDEILPADKKEEK